MLLYVVNLKFIILSPWIIFLFISDWIALRSQLKRDFDSELVKNILNTLPPFSAAMQNKKSIAADEWTAFLYYYYHTQNYYHQLQLLTISTLIVSNGSDIDSITILKELVMTTAQNNYAKKRIKFTAVKNSNYTQTKMKRWLPKWR